jgi:Zn-dependent protease
LASILVVGVFVSMLFFETRIDIIFILFIALGGVFIFLIHEFAHKYLARHYGYFSEFRIIREGALFTAISMIPFFPLKFIAPGSVFVKNWSASTEENGRIALIGPMTNLVLTGLFLISSGVMEYSVPLIGANLVIQISIGFFYLAFISVSIAMFNLIPFGPMDGLKVLNWDREVFIAMFGFTAVTWILLLSSF